jgi:hypothetical protein
MIPFPGCINRRLRVASQLGANIGSSHLEAESSG